MSLILEVLDCWRILVDMLALQPPELGIDCTSVPEFLQTSPQKLGKLGWSLPLIEYAPELAVYTLW